MGAVEGEGVIEGHLYRVVRPHYVAGVVVSPTTGRIMVAAPILGRWTGSRVVDLHAQIVAIGGSIERLK